MGLISRVSSRTYREIWAKNKKNMSDDSDAGSIPDPNMIEFSDDDEPVSESGESMASDDPFRQHLQDDDNEEPEPEFNPLDQIASGGIFSESSDISSSIGTETVGSFPTAS